MLRIELSILTSYSQIRDFTLTNQEEVVRRCMPSNTFRYTSLQFALFTIPGFIASSDLFILSEDSHYMYIDLLDFKT